MKAQLQMQKKPQASSRTVRYAPAAHTWKQVELSTTAEVFPAALAPRIQAKRLLSSPGDRYEREADTMAQKAVALLHAPAFQPPAKLAGKGLVPPPLVQCASEGSGGEAIPPEAERNLEEARGGGQALPDTVREPLERAFGADFHAVRAHTDARSDRLSRSFNALAFTTGQDIFFRRGAYQPESPGGQELLAHELTHVVQQSGGATSQPLLQRKWNPINGASGIYYQHIDSGGVVTEEFKHLEGVAYIRDKDIIYSEDSNEDLFIRKERRFQGLTYTSTPFGTRAVGQTAGFSMNMRLVTPPPSNKLLTSNQALFTKGSKKGLTTVTKIPKTKGKFRDHPYKKVLSRGHSFVYIGDGEEREPNPSAAIDPSPPKPNGTLGGTKTKSIKLYSPAAKAGRSDTAAAMGVNAVSHAVANNAKLPKDVKPAKSRRWEWLHLIGDAVGGPTVPGNLACGTYDGNTQHNTIEEAVIEASQQATATDPLEYTVKATLITGTAIAKKFECKADLPSGRQITWEPVDTLRISKLDTVEDALRRYQAQRNI